MTIQFKQFRTTGKDIRITSVSGHVAIITKEFSSIPSILWGEAYAAGAISEDMKSTDLNDFIEAEKTKKKEELDKEKEDLKNTLRTAFNNPISYVDKNNNPVHRKLIALIGKPIKKDLIDSLWNELIEENKDN